MIHIDSNSCKKEKTASYIILQEIPNTISYLCCFNSVSSIRSVLIDTFTSKNICISKIFYFCQVCQAQQKKNKPNTEFSLGLICFNTQKAYLQKLHVEESKVMPRENLTANYRSTWHLPEKQLVRNDEQIEVLFSEGIIYLILMNKFP